MSKLCETIADNDRCGYGKQFYTKQLEIIIWDDDKIDIPHFHIVDTKTLGKDFHTRILIEKPEYYEGETTKLNEEQVKSLMEHFNSSNDKTDMFQNNWQTLLFFWNMNNENKVSNQIMPNYTKLK